MRQRLLWVAVAIAPLWARAAEPTLLEHVLVTVPIHRTAAETALPVTVLSAEELRESAAASIGAALDGRPGLSSASFGPGVGQPVVRGQQGPRVKVLQNSTGSLDASRVSADHAVSVEPLLADSVEVLRGPATLLYGGGAIGGVVNVIDGRIPVRALETPSAALELRHGSGADADTAVFRGEAPGGGLNWHLSGVYRDWGLVEIPGDAVDHSARAEPELEEEPESTRGVLDNSDGRMHQITVGSSWTFERGYLGLAVSRLENEYGIPPGGHGHHEEEHEGGAEAELDGEQEEDHGGIRIDLEQTRVDVAGEYRPEGGIETLRGRFSYNDYEHRELEGSGEVGTVYSNEAWEGRFELVHRRLAGWHGVLGLQLSHSDFAAIGEEGFIPRADSRSVGLFVVEDYHWRDWTFELGLRVDRDRVDPQGISAEDFTSLSGSAAALWDIDEHWALGLALSRSERAPVVEELFSNAGNGPATRVAHGATQAVEVGDAGLDTERSRNLDLSLRWQRRGLSAELTAFVNDFQDFIYLEDTGEELEELPVLAYRQQDARFHGLEYAFTAPLVEATWGVLELTLYGDLVRGELDRGGDVPRLPPRRVGLRADLEWGLLRAHVDVLDAAEQDRVGLNESRTDGYTRVNAGISYALTLLGSEARVFLHGHNLGDREIRQSTSFLREFAPEPGRSVEAGIRLVF